MSEIDPYKYEGVYIGLSEENIIVICDLFTKGVFIISTVSDGVIVPFGLGEYKVQDDKFIIEPQRGWIFMMPNLERVVGSLMPKSNLKFSGLTAYYHASIAGREPFKIDIDNIERNPMPERYEKDVMDSISGFDFSKYDFSGYDLEDALVTAGIDAAELAANKGPERFIIKKKPVKPGPDWSLLYDAKSGKRIPGAYLDENYDFKLRYEKVKKYITHAEASALKNFENVSYNLEEDQRKEIKRAAAANREIQDRMDGCYDPDKDYNKFENTEELKKWASLGDIEGLDKYFTEDGGNVNTDEKIAKTGTKNSEVEQSIEVTTLPGVIAEADSCRAAVKDNPTSETADVPKNTAQETESTVNGNQPVSEKRVVYCLCYEKMLYFGGNYVYFVIFLQVENGYATKVFLSTINKEKRNLEGWRELFQKAAEKINNSTYLLFRNTSFNFVMKISDILPNTVHCGNIGDIPSDEAFRKETLALSSKISSALYNLRAGSDLPSTFASLTAFMKEVGAVDISII